MYRLLPAWNCALQIKIIFGNVTLHNQAEMYCWFIFGAKEKFLWNAGFYLPDLNDGTFPETHCCGELQMSHVAGTFQKKMRTFAAKAKTRTKHYTTRIIQNPDLWLCFPYISPSPYFLWLQSWVPNSISKREKNHTWPFFMTRILSHVVTDDSLCAIVKIVQCLNSFWTVLWTATSVSGSTDAVASSKIRICKTQYHQQIKKKKGVNAVSSKTSYTTDSTKCISL